MTFKSLNVQNQRRLVIFGKCEWAMQNFCISNSVKLESVFIYMVN